MLLTDKTSLDRQASLASLLCPLTSLSRAHWLTLKTFRSSFAFIRAIILVVSILNPAFKASGYRTIRVLDFSEEKAATKQKSQV